MRMAAIFSNDGRLLGHVNLDFCARHRDFYCVDNANYAPISAPEAVIDDSVEYFRIPVKTIRFKDGVHEAAFSHLVVSDKVPDWLWESGKAVKFSPEHWSE